MKDGRSLGFVIICCGALLATAWTSVALAEPLGPEVQWKDPSSVRLEVDFPGNGYHASWQLFRRNTGDLLIRSELNEPGEVVHGDILLVANRAVLSRGYEEEAEELISYDAPALMMQLGLRLLERSEPAGPSAVTERVSTETSDDINYIHLDTGAAVGGFPPPWKVTGTLAPDGDTRRKFDLRFSFNAGGAAGTAEQEAEMRLSGSAEYAAGEFPVADDLELGPWLLSWRDPEDPAGKSGETPETLGELRALLKKIPEAAQ